MTLRQRQPRVRDRFFDKVMTEPNSGCWIWMGSLNRGGYGTFHFEGKSSSAHRVSYILYKGEIPDGLDLDHLCRVRCCVNPDHLEAVTHQENIVRGIGPKKVSLRLKSKTHCKNGHEYTDDNIYESRGSRNCRECRKAAKRKYNKRLKDKRHA